MRLVVVALCAALVALAAAAAPHSWVTVTAPRELLHDQALARVADLRGVYGQRDSGLRTALVAVPHADAALTLDVLASDVTMVVHDDAASKLVSDDEFRLWAVEQPETLAPEARAALRSLLDTYDHFAAHDAAGVVFVHMPLAHAVDWPAGVQAIRVPRRAMRPVPASLAESPAGKYLRTLAKNDVIATAIARISKDELYATDLALSEDFVTRQSASNGIKEASAYLQERFRSFGITRVTTQTYRSDYAPNVIAEIRGMVEPNKYVIVGAHYDSRNTNSADTTGRAPGADDNGSGTSAVVELARVIASLNNTFVYSIRFVLFTGEEQGLLGSEAYAGMISDEGQEVVAFFNADMLGYRIPGQPIEMGMKDRSITQWLLEVSYAIDALYVPQLPVKLSSSCCSDYISFYEVGYPAIGFFENPTTASTYPQYHTSQDVITNLDFDQIQLEASAILANLMTFAVPN